MRRVFAALVAQRGLILILALAMLLGGAIVMEGLPVDAVPDISPKQVMILTEAPGLGPLEVERLVTIPIETQMTGLPQLKDVRSTSRFGLSAVYVTLDDSADEQSARAQVFERLQQAQAMMPPGVGTPVEGPFATGLGEILEFELRGPGYTPMQLYQLLKWRIVPKLRLVPGIVDVNIYGGDLQTYEVRIAPDRLQAEHVSLTQVMDALQANNVAGGGGVVAQGDGQAIVRGLALASSKADISAIILRTGGDGIPVRIADVADVVVAPKLRLGAVTHDGKGETILGVAVMQYGRNTSQVLPALKSAIASVQKQLPPGVAIMPFYDRSDLIHRTINTVKHNLIEGAVLVTVLLLLMLGNARAGLIVALVIPLSMVMAFAGMRLFRISGNLMSLGAIDFGLIVDGAVVMVENILRQHKDAGEDELQKIIPQAAAEVARPVAFSVLIITLVYVPVLSLQDVEGKTFRPMALTVMLALGSALAVTMLVVPALSALFLSAKAEGRETWTVRWARRLYTPVFKRSAARPLTTLAIAAACFGGAAFLATRLGGEFIPQLSEGAIVITSNKLPSINLAASEAIATRIERVAKTFPDVQSVVSQTGSAATPTDPMGVQSTDTYVILKPRSEWKTADTQQGIAAAMEEKMKAEIPGAAFSFSQPIQMRMDDLLEGVRADVSLTIYGPDLSTLSRLGDQVNGLVSSVKGAADVHVERISGLPAISIRVDRSRIARFGLNASDILNIVQVVGGKQAGMVYATDGAESPLIVRLPPASRATVSALRNLPVELPRGGSVPLSEVAEISLADGPAQVLRDKLERRINLDINVRGRDVSTFVAEAQRKIGSSVHLPPEYRLEWGGMFKNLQSASARLALVGPAVLAAIFLLLYVNFGSLRTTTLIFLNVPMAITGGILALILRGMPFSVTAAIGFISVIGIAILDGVVLVSYIETERQAGLAPRDAASEAAGKRLRPVLTTALVASVGFIPMAVSTTVGAEVQRPLATVVIGGLITATILTLLVLPSLYPVVAEARLPAALRRRLPIQDQRSGGDQDR